MSTLSMFTEHRAALELVRTQLTEIAHISTPELDRSDRQPGEPMWSLVLDLSPSFPKLKDQMIEVLDTVYPAVTVHKTVIHLEFDRDDNSAPVTASTRAPRSSMMDTLLR